MTTPPTPAGWYPDPDGSGQRYWDGTSWTEHRSPAAHTPPPPAPVAPPAEPDASAQPAAVVQLRSVPSEQRVGAHRKPDSESAPEPRLAAEPESFTQTTESVSLRSTSEVPPPPPPLELVPAPRPVDPLFDASAPGSGSTPPNGNRSLVIKYGVACAALLAVLVGLAIYGFLIKKAPQVQLSTPGGGDGTTQAPPTGDWGGPSEAPPAGPTGWAADGPLSFTVHGIDAGPTIYQSDPPMEKNAAGEYFVMHMTVMNTGSDAATFVAMFQKLHAAGTAYQPDEEATAYLGSTSAELQPSASQDVWIAFDLPPDTEPEAIEWHAESGSPGVQVPLS